MTAGKEVPQTVADLVLKRCQKLIDWYERAKNHQRWLDYMAQTLTIGMAGITPLLVMTDSIVDWAKALPAVVATVAAGLNAAFRFRATYVNFAYAGERLKAEKLRFEVRLVTADDPAREAEAFVARIEGIVMAELGEWREGLLRADTSVSMREGVEQLSKQTLAKGRSPRPRRRRS